GSANSSGREQLYEDLLYETATVLVPAHPQKLSPRLWGCSALQPLSVYGFQRCPHACGGVPLYQDRCYGEKPFDQQAEAIAQRVFQGDFTPTPHKTCYGICPFSEICDHCLTE
ncbi:PD-(D/E)XK nuclease family protein, partial [Lyngbya confervoides]